MWKKLLLLVVALGFVGIVGATIYVNNIDWNKHKDKIASQFSNATGKEVVFNGAVSFNILPSPYLEASDIQIYNDKNGNGEKVLLANIKKLVAKLSIRSLITGNFNVERMSLVEPEFFVEYFSNGKLNWQSDSGNQQDFEVDNVEISLDSLTIEKAKMTLTCEEYDVNAVLEDITAEVISQSLFGPYRIEGSYTKNNSINGFAISLGQFSGSFATSVNAVLSHPQSESYLRFEGTVLLNNDAINGNLIFESQNPVNFINSNLRNFKISEDYEYPTALSIELKTDKTQIALSNIVLKYGQSAGAGNILIPRLETKIGYEEPTRRRIDAVFNMTEFQLDPAIQVIKDFIKKYDGDVDYIPDYGFDIIADMKSVKTMYNNQVIRDFDLSFDFMDNIFKLQNFSATLPGETGVKLKGEVYSVEKELTYAFDGTSSTSDLAKFADWLGYKLDVISQGTYKKASLTAAMSGTFSTIKITPFDFIMDKTATNGQIGIVRGDKDRWFAIINMDNLNLDSYLANLPVELENASLEEKINYNFKKLAKLNDLDLQYRYSLNSGIYGKVPFENLSSEGVLNNGVLKADLNVEALASADISLKGEFSGFGNTPQVKNLNYKIDIKDVTSFAEKLKISIPNIDLKALSGFSSNGIITGSMQRAATKATSRLGNVDVTYTGEMAKQNGIYNVSGNLDVRAPDFVKFVNGMYFNYNPDYPLGLFKLTSNIKGNANAFMLKDMAANIGANTFNGDIIYVKREGRNQIKADLKVNRFEFEKFLYNEKGDKESFRSATDGATFIAKPKFSLAKINYDWLKNLDIDGRIEVDNMTYRNKSITNASIQMLLNKEVLKVSNFEGNIAKGTIDGNFELNIPLDAKLTGLLNFKGVDVNKDVWSGTIYGLTKGSFDGKFVFDTSASSADSLLTSLTGSLAFSISDPIFKGWDLLKIEEDLKVREKSEGFITIARESLSKGETQFRNLKGEIRFENGNFSIDNTTFVSDEVSVSVIADGTLRGWIANSSMQAVYHYVPNATTFDFSLDGGINIPALDVDVSKINTVYDSHWEKIAQDAKAAEEAKIKMYRELMDNEQYKANELKDRLLDTVVPEYNAQSELARDDYMVAQYNEIGDQIDKVNASLEEVFASNDMTTISDADIEKLKTQNASIEKMIEQISKNLKNVHAKDVKLRVNQSFNDIFEVYNQSKAIASKQLETYGEFDKRLAAINTKFSTRHDKNIIDWKRQIEESMLAIDEINAEISRENVIAQNITDVADLEQYSSRFDLAKKAVNDELAKIETIAKNLSEYTENKVKAEERAYRERLEEEKLKKKLEENVGQISNSKGRTVTVERDLNDIQRSEDALRKEEIRVLDFSGEESRATGSISSSRGRRKTTTVTTTTTYPSEGIIIKRSTETSTEPGGVIVRP